MSRASRLFELLSVLRARRRPATAIELAHDLNVSKRSVYRDIETLRLLGAPIDGQAGIGFVLKDGFFLPHFAFSPEEIDALILGLGWVQQRGDPALVQSSDSALAKILSARADGSQSSNELPPLFTAASVTERTDPPLVAPLRDAIRRQRKASSTIRMEAGRSPAEPSGPLPSSTSMMCAWLLHGAKHAHRFATSALIAFKRS